MAVIRAMDADILAVQEFQVERGRRAALPDAEEFARAAGYAVLQQPVRRVAGDYQANLLMSRLPMRHGGFIDLHFGRTEPRGAIHADLDLDGQILRVVTTHLGLTPGARGRQLDEILARCRPHEAQPFVLMGDLNAWMPWEPVDRRLRREFRGHAQPASFPAGRPVLPLDRIVARPTRAVRHAAAFVEEPAPRASDHLPVVADLAFS